MLLGADHNCAPSPSFTSDLHSYTRLSPVLAHSVPFVCLMFLPPGLVSCGLPSFIHSYVFVPSLEDVCKERTESKRGACPNHTGKQMDWIDLAEVSDSGVILCAWLLLRTVAKS